MKWENWAPAKIATTAVAIAGTVLGGFIFMDDRHAQAEEVKALKRYTVYTLKEVELDSAIARLEIILSIPVAERHVWQVREIDRLERRVQLMQLKLKVDDLVVKNE